MFGNESERVLAQYPAASDDEAPKALEKLVTDGYFIAPTRAWARARSKGKSSTFVYHFTRVSPGAKLLGLGAHHAAEIRYVFETLDAPGPASFVKKDRALSKTLSATWV